jgi:hypothetical protein
MFVGLHHEGVELRHQIHFARERALTTANHVLSEGCPHCGQGAGSRRARGDRARLPCRAS